MKLTFTHIHTYIHAIEIILYSPHTYSHPLYIFNFTSLHTCHRNNIIFPTYILSPIIYFQLHLTFSLQTTVLVIRTSYNLISQSLTLPFPKLKWVFVVFLFLFFNVLNFAPNLMGGFLFLFDLERGRKEWWR